MLRPLGCNCSEKSGNWRNRPFTDPYRRLTAPCGNPDCRCHHGGPKHGPHLYISYRGKEGKTTGYYVPHRAKAQIRQGVEAWSQLQDRLRELK